MTIGVGTGSTVNYFIEALASVKAKIEYAVSSSNATTQLLKQFNIPVAELNAVGHVDLYVDGADEVNNYMQCIKGGGGALTGEKIIASTAKTFVCIVDESKRVNMLGKFPIAVEVIPMARSAVAKEIVQLGGDPVLRHNFKTDYGNVILDIHNMNLLDPVEMEKAINNIPGVVCNGIFALRTADVVIVGSPQRVQIIQ